jgi:hypothetical protein
MRIWGKMKGPLPGQQPQPLGDIGAHRKAQSGLVPGLERGEDQAVMLRRFGAVEPPVEARIVGPSCSQTVSASASIAGA